MLPSTFQIVIVLPSPVQVVIVLSSTLKVVLLLLSTLKVVTVLPFNLQTNVFLGVTSLLYISHIAGSDIQHYQTSGYLLFL